MIVRRMPTRLSLFLFVSSGSACDDEVGDDRFRRAVQRVQDQGGKSPMRPW